MKYAIALFMLVSVLVTPVAFAREEADVVPVKDLTQEVVPAAQNFFQKAFTWSEGYRLKWAEDVRAYQAKQDAKVKELDSQIPDAVGKDVADLLKNDNGEVMPATATAHTAGAKIVARIAYVASGILLFILGQQVFFYGVIAIIAIALVRSIIGRLRGDL